MHLSPDDIATAVDGFLGETARAHLETCAACRDRVAEVSELVANVKSEPVPEPSPLFWDHFSARVREATARESTPDGRLWLFGRPFWVVGTLAAIAVLVTFWAHPSRDPDVTSPVPASAKSGESVPTPDLAWQTMVDMAASMTVDDVRTATAPAPDRSGVLSDLSEDERAAFVALLRMEVGDVQ